MYLLSSPAGECFSNSCSLNELLFIGLLKGTPSRSDLVFIQSFSGGRHDGIGQRGKVMAIVFVRVAGFQIRVHGANGLIDLPAGSLSADLSIADGKIFCVAKAVFPEHERAVHIQQQRLFPSEDGVVHDFHRGGGLGFSGTGQTAFDRGFVAG